MGLHCAWCTSIYISATVNCHVMITTRLDLNGGYAQPFITMFVYYLSLYRLLRGSLVIMTNLPTYCYIYSYDMLSFTVCLYAMCDMAILQSVDLFF